MAERRITQSERAHRHLTEAILRGRWHTGDTVSAYALAEELDMSRTPIVAALRRLESEGFVEIIPQVGCRIVHPGVSAVGELFVLRGALDGLAAAAAARRIDDATLSELDGMLQQLEAVASPGDPAAFAELDHGFHSRIIDAGGMPRLAHMARSVWLPLRYQLARGPLPIAEIPDSTREHREIFDGIRRRAPERARAAAERHATRSARRFLADLEHRPGGPHQREGLVHQALIYASDEEFLGATVPFVIEALSEGARVLAVTSSHNIELLQSELGPRAEQVEWRDSREWYRTPSDTLLGYQRYVAEHANGTRVRLIGEVDWSGLSLAASSEWTRYESTLNVAFAVTPVSFLCPYDARVLPDPTIAAARRTHPEIRSATDISPSPEYTDFFAPLGGGPSPG